jgi:hypothetical protein
MHTVLSGLVGTKALTYLDDTVIWGANLDEHNQRLVEVLGTSDPANITRVALKLTDNSSCARIHLAFFLSMY